jgi:hypothetical protein
VVVVADASDAIRFQSAQRVVPFAKTTESNSTANAAVAAAGAATHRVTPSPRTTRMRRVRLLPADGRPTNRLAKLVLSKEKSVSACRRGRRPGDGRWMGFVLGHDFTIYKQREVREYGRSLANGQRERRAKPRFRFLRTESPPEKPAQLLAL